MGEIIALVGGYGSGKTEIAVNMALTFAETGKTLLVDMDIVNPFFRSSEKKSMLKAHGVDVMSPEYANTNVDLPTLPVGLQKAFIPGLSVIMDVGGDFSGAAALGGISSVLKERKAEIYFVVNTARPLTSDVPSVLRMMELVSISSRIELTGIIHNTNLARETTVEDLISGQIIVDEVSRQSGVPVVMVCGMKRVLSEYEEYLSMKGESNLTFNPIEIYMRPDWLDG